MSAEKSAGALDRMTDYRLHTIQDILDKIPHDRIQTCMKELTEVLLQVSAMNATMPGNTARFSFMDGLLWVDDNKGTLEAHYHVGDDTIITKAKIKSE